MIIGLEWYKVGTNYQTNEQTIAYRHNDEKIIFHNVVFVATYDFSNREYYPVIDVYINDEHKLSMSYRHHNTIKDAVQFAKEEIEIAIGGTYDDGILHHWTLHNWCRKLIDGLSKLVLDKN